MRTALILMMCAALLGCGRSHRHEAYRATPRYLTCNDGTQSPTCTTADPSIKGCCSGHGGVR